MPEQAFRTWLASAEPVSLDAGGLHVRGASQFHAEWMEDKFGPLLQEAAAAVAGEAVAIRFSFVAGREDPAAGPPEILADSVEHPEPPAARGRAAAGPGDPPNLAPGDPPAAHGISARYTFERFIVGENNRLAQAASLAVAERPAHAYNPLFLYGDTGLGKTHLMQAIGNHVRASSAAARICYISAEQFMNEMITAISERTNEAFRARYRSFDLLLVDDVQFWRKKERTQEEFFHTFNSLYDGERQMVLASDRRPKDLDGLDARLVSRFEWGLVADVSAPDYETRLAILRKKADEDDVALAPEVLELVARSCRSSVRELEGTLIKLLAFSSLTQRAIDVGLARTALAGAVRADARPEASPEAIRDSVAEAWGVTGAALASRSRTRNVAVPRQVAMFLVKETLDLPLQQIGGLFGGRDHSTVLHSIRKVQRQLEDDPAFRAQVADARTRLRHLQPARRAG